MLADHPIVTGDDRWRNFDWRNVQILATPRVVSHRWHTSDTSQLWKGTAGSPHPHNVFSAANNNYQRQQQPHQQYVLVRSTSSQRLASNQGISTAAHNNPVHTKTTVVRQSPLLIETSPRLAYSASTVPSFNSLHLAHHRFDDRYNNPTSVFTSSSSSDSYLPSQSYVRSASTFRAPTTVVTPRRVIRSDSAPRVLRLNSEIVHTPTVGLGSARYSALQTHRPTPTRGQSTGLSTSSSLTSHPYTMSSSRSRHVIVSQPVGGSAFRSSSQQRPSPHSSQGGPQSGPTTSYAAAPMQRRPNYTSPPTHPQHAQHGAKDYGMPSTQDYPDTSSLRSQTPKLSPAQEAHAAYLLHNVIGSTANSGHTSSTSRSSQQSTTNRSRSQPRTGSKSQRVRDVIPPPQQDKALHYVAYASAAGGPLVSPHVGMPTSHGSASVPSPGQPTPVGYILQPPTESVPSHGHQQLYLNADQYGAVDTTGHTHVSHLSSPQQQPSGRHKSMPTAADAHHRRHHRRDEAAPHELPPRAPSQSRSSARRDPSRQHQRPQEPLWDPSRPNDAYDRQSSRPNDAYDRQYERQTSTTSARSRHRPHRQQRPENEIDDGCGDIPHEREHHRHHTQPLPGEHRSASSRRRHCDHSYVVPHSTDIGGAVPSALDVPGYPASTLSTLELSPGRHAPPASDTYSSTSSSRHQSSRRHRHRNHSQNDEAPEAYYHRHHHSDRDRIAKSNQSSQRDEYGGAYIRDINGDVSQTSSASPSRKVSAVRAPSVGELQHAPPSTQHPAERSNRRHSRSRHHTPIESRPPHNDNQWSGGGGAEELFGSQPLTATLTAPSSRPASSVLSFDDEGRVVDWGAERGAPRRSGDRHSKAEGGGYQQGGRGSGRGDGVLPSGQRSGGERGQHQRSLTPPRHVEQHDERGRDLDRHVEQQHYEERVARQRGYDDGRSSRRQEGDGYGSVRSDMGEDRVEAKRKREAHYGDRGGYEEHWDANEHVGSGVSTKQVAERQAPRRRYPGDERKDSYGSSNAYQYVDGDVSYGGGKGQVERKASRQSRMSVEDDNLTAVHPNGDRHDKHDNHDKHNNDSTRLAATPPTRQEQQLASPRREQRSLTAPNMGNQQQQVAAGGGGVAVPPVKMNGVHDADELTDYEPARLSPSRRNNATFDEIRRINERNLALLRNSHVGKFMTGQGGKSQDLHALKDRLTNPDKPRLQSSVSVPNIAAECDTANSSREDLQRCDSDNNNTCRTGDTHESQFESSNEFTGSRHGYYFGTGSKGTGYYKDVPGAEHESQNVEGIPTVAPPPKQSQPARAHPPPPPIAERPHRLVPDPKFQQVQQVHSHSFMIQRYDASGGKPSVRKIDVIRIYQTPELFVIPDFLTAEECQEMMSRVEGNNSEPLQWASSQSNEGNYIPERPMRTSTTKRFDYHADGFIITVERRAAAFAQTSMTKVEKLVVAKYEEGDYCNGHSDGPDRQQTIVVFLNDVPDGGEMDFINLGFQVRPQRGTGLMWANLSAGELDPRLKRAALAPMGGTKYVLKCFVNVQDVSPALEIMTDGGDDE